MKLNIALFAGGEIGIRSLNWANLYQRPLRKMAIDGLSPETSGMSFLRMSFLSEVYSGIDEIDRLRREFVFQSKYSDSNLMPYLGPCLRSELSST